MLHLIKGFLVPAEEIMRVDLKRLYSEIGARNDQILSGWKKRSWVLQWHAVSLNIHQSHAECIWSLREELTYKDFPLQSADLKPAAALSVLGKFVGKEVKKKIYFDVLLFFWSSTLNILVMF